MSVKEGSLALLSILKKGVHLAQGKGVLDRINQKWMGVTYPSQESFWERYKLFIEVLASVVIVVLALVWSWNARLRREVNRRTHALAKSESTLKTILAASPVGIGIVRDRKINWMNDAMTAMLEYSLQELEGEYYSILYSDANRCREVNRAIDAALVGKNFAVVETRWRRKNGTEFDCLLRYAPVQSADRENLAIVIAEDITERKQYEKGLRRAKTEWERTFNTVPDLIMVLDENHCIQKMNRAMAETFALSTGFIGDLKCYEHVHGTSSPPSFCPHTKLLQDGQEHTTEIYEKNLDRHFIVSVSPLSGTNGQITGSVHVARDITDRKVHEERIQKLSTLRARLIQAGNLTEKLNIISAGMTDLFDSLFFRLWMVETDVFCDGAKKPEAVTSTEQKLTLDGTCFNLVAESTIGMAQDQTSDWFRREHDYLEQLLTGRESKRVSTLPWRGTSDEKYFHVGFRIVSASGLTIGLFSIISQHTLSPEESNLLEAVVETTRQSLEAERTAKALKESEKRYRHLFETLIDVYFRTDATGKITMISPSVEQVIGVPAEEILGTHTFDYYHDPGLRKQLLWTIRQKAALKNHEIMLRKIDGGFIWVSFNARMIENSQGEFDGVEGLFRDITTNKKAEELMRIQRDLGTALGHTSSLNQALDVCLDAVSKVEHVDCAGIYLIDAGSGDLNLMAHRGMHPEFIQTMSHLSNNSPQARLISEGKSVFQSYADMMIGFDFSPEQLKRWETFGFRAMAVIPMFHEGRIIGCLYAASTNSDALADFARFSLETIASQIAGALTRIQTGQALLVSQRNLETLFDSLDDFLFILNSEGNIVNVNASVEKRLGFSREELLHMNVTRVHPPEHRQEVTAMIQAILASKLDVCSVPLMTQNGRTIPVETKFNQGTWNGHHALFGISRDISRRLAAENAQKISEERLKAAIEAIDEGFVLYDAQDRLVMCNAKYMDIYRESADLIHPGAKFEDIIREGAHRGQYLSARDDIDAWVAKRLDHHRHCDDDVEQQLGDGRWIRIAERKMSNGSTVGFRVDITDIKRAGEMAQKALQEKEILLKEIHHRVKNNMQVVSSLLSLQANQIESPQVLDIFAEAQSRIQSMALVHETLYRSDSLTQIKLRDYLDQLISQIVHLFHYQSGRIEVSTHTGGVALGVDQAATCGLIVVELMTNALKYAFPENRRGSIRIHANMQGDDQVLLKVSDNGIGLLGKIQSTRRQDAGAEHGDRPGRGSAGRNLDD